MSLKLTQSLRDHIQGAILTNRFSSDEKALEKRQGDLARIIYEDVFDQKTRKKMASLPEGWLSTEDYVRVEIAGQVKSLRLPKPCRFPFNKRSNVLRVYDARHPIASEYQQYRNDRDDLQKSRTGLAAKLSAVLGSATTVKKLVELWPEAEPFVPKEPVKASLPAINFSDLNKSLRLPVEKKPALASLESSK
jgi:hypothetical protein